MAVLSNAGALWNSVVQIAPETDYNVAVAALGNAYLTSPTMPYTLPSYDHHFASGRPDDVGAMTYGVPSVGGGFTMPLSADEITDWLTMLIKGTTTYAVPDGASAAHLWTLKHTVNVPPYSATIRYYDGARIWVATGMVVSSVRIAGRTNEQNTVTVEWMGAQKVSGSLTGSLASRTPVYQMGWETALFIDAFGGTRGATQVSTNLLAWDVTVRRPWGMKKFADGAQFINAAVPGRFEVTGSLTFEASAAATLTEYGNWMQSDPVKRLICLQWGNTKQIESGFNRFVRLTVPSKWTAWATDQEDAESRVYNAEFRYIYDPTNAYGVQFELQNTREAFA